MTLPPPPTETDELRMRLNRALPDLDLALKSALVGMIAGIGMMILVGLGA